MAKLYHVFRCLSLLTLFVGSTLCQTSGIGSALNKQILTPASMEIQKAIEGQKALIQSLIGVDPETKFSELFPDIKKFNITKIVECYDLSIGETVYNLFENSIFVSIQTFYKNFPENFVLSKIGDKIKNLHQSMREISAHTLQCLTKPSELRLGFTQLTDFSDKEYKMLLGSKQTDMERAISKYVTRPLAANADDEDSSSSSESNANNNNNKNRTLSTNNSTNDNNKKNIGNSSSTSSSSGGSNNSGKVNQIGLGIGNGNSGGGGGAGILRSSGGSNKKKKRVRRQQVTVDPICFPKNKSPLPEKFDWKSKGKVTPARYQGSCGSCWAFASLAILESAYLIKGKTNNKKFDLSEQQLLNCAREKGCDGGTSVDAFNFILKNRGVTDESENPYDFKKERCEVKKKKKHAKIRDYCLRGVYALVNGKPENLTDTDIQQVIREFGPVYATINADDVAVKHIKNGVYNNRKCPKVTNHAITIVGWDKKSWIIKNSWGKKWGNDGFFRIKRGENMCGINTYITYAIV